MSFHKWIVAVLILALTMCMTSALSSGLFTATVTLENKSATYCGAAIAIEPAVVTGMEGQSAPTGDITYIYYDSLNAPCPAHPPMRARIMSWHILQET